MSLSILVPRSKSNPVHTQEIKKWVRDIFQLSEDITVMVTELQCSEPGCPPLETVIAIMGVGHNNKSQHKLHKAIHEVTVEDIKALRSDSPRPAANVRKKHSDEES